MKFLGPLLVPLVGLLLTPGCIIATDEPVVLTQGHSHGDGCGHYYWTCSNGWYKVPHDHCRRCRPAPHVCSVYTNNQCKCGKWYWHGGWYTYAHPTNCAQCAPPPHVHVLYANGQCKCGYWYWHNGWYAHTHPGNCAQCAPPPHCHVIHSADRCSCGWYFWHGGWHPNPHPSTCHS